MKKIVIILIMIFLITSCSQKENTLINNISNIENTNEEDLPLKDNYIDNNPVKVSIYAEDDNNYLVKVIDKYETTWEKKKDIVVLATLPTDISNPEQGYMPNLWPKYNEVYNDLDYKVVWNVSFKLKDGTIINSNLFKPSDAESYYSFLEVYLYDDVNIPIGTWHSHLLDEDITDNTIMDSIKLTAGENYTEITGPITLTVFSYDTSDDFDENNNYRGKSLYKVEIYNH